MSKEEQSEEQVFRSFLEVLSSNAPIAIPLDTLFGAITHFLSTLEGDSLNKLISAVLTSTSLWNISDANQKILQAPRLAVSTKVDTIDKALGKAYFSVYRKNKVARQWLGRIAQPIISAELSLPRTVIMRGLVQGLSDNQQIVWGRSRARLEEELVIECATTVDNLEGIELLCTTIVCVDENRLKALDLEVSSSRPLMEYPS